MSSTNYMLYEEAEGIGAFDWQNLIGQGFGFGNNFLQAKYGKDVAKWQAIAAAQQPAAPVLTAPGGGSGAARPDDGEGINAGANKGGFYIGQTFVPWWAAAVAGGAVFLLQSPGFQRRGR